MKCSKTKAVQTRLYDELVGFSTTLSCWRCMGPTRDSFTPNGVVSVWEEEGSVLGVSLTCFFFQEQFLFSPISQGEMSNLKGP